MNNNLESHIQDILTYTNIRANKSFLPAEQDRSMTESSGEHLDGMTT